MAIDELLDEHEQSERVRSWLRGNAAGLIGGVVLGLGLIGGWQWWQKHQHDQRALAGQRFALAVETLETGDVSKVDLKALQGTAYEPLAALAAAKAQVDAGKNDAAIATLRGVLGSESDLKEVVEQRLARLLIDSGKPKEALTLLADAQGAGALEARGDAEFADGQKEAARASYAKALAVTDVASPQRRLIELKLSEAGGAPEQAPASSPAATKADS